MLAVSSRASGAVAATVGQRAQDLLDGTERVGDVAGEDRTRVDGTELERGDHAEVAAAATQRPQEVQVAIRPGDDLLAGGGDELGADQVVAGEPLDPRQPADPAAEGEPADAGVPERAADDGEVMRPGRRVDVLPERSTRDTHDPLHRVDADLAPVAHVDDEGAIGHRMAGHAVPTAPHRDRQAEVGGRHDGGDHVVVRTDPDDHSGPSLDGRVEGCPRRVILHIRGREDAVLERLAQAIDDEPLHATPRSHHRSRKQATYKGQVYTLVRAPSGASADATASSHGGRPARQRDRTDPLPAANPGAAVTVPILPTIQEPADLRGLDEVQLAQLAVEIRDTIVRTVARTGGHLGSSLGVVELTIALHRLLESPRDRIVWDTGHQAYPHKLLTGRLERFGTLRQLDGIGGFPRRSESEHDVFDGGHAGTGLSIAEGLAEARDLRHGLERIAVVVGDAALMSGLSLEALNDIGQRQTQMLIVLNDNEMSISPTVGAFSTYLSKIKLSRTWRQGKSAYDRTVERIPVVGGTVLELSRRLRKSVVSFAQPGQLFEDLGITYIGVVPGHDLHALLVTLDRALALPGPTIVHVRTQKGRGFRPAETDQVGFHGAALPPITMAPAADAYDGSRATMPSESMTDDAAPPTRIIEAPTKHPNYTAVFAAELIELARHDRRIVGITAGMPTGTGHVEVPGRVPGPDVRRRHRRAALDGDGHRPGDGRHATGRRAVFDIPPASVRPDRPRRLPERPAGRHRGRPVGTGRRGRHESPGDVHPAGAAPAAEPRDRIAEGRAGAALAAPHRARRRITRSRSTTHVIRASDWRRSTPEVIPVGRGEVLREGRDLLFVGFGPIVARAVAAADLLAEEGWSIGVINARYARPLDRQLILDQARGKRLLVTFEESVVAGGFGSGVLELIEEARLADPAYREVAVRILGIPGERFVDHGSVADLRRVLRLDAPGLAGQVREALETLSATPGRSEVATG